MMRRWQRLARDAVGPLSGFQADDRLLVRIKKTTPQTGLTRRQRKANLAGAFAVTDGHLVKNRRILLVDDVMTTGATVQACAATLRKSGARDIHILTLARAI